jgi:hypothetical protein
VGARRYYLLSISSHARVMMVGARQGAYSGLEEASAGIPRELRMPPFRVVIFPGELQLIRRRTFDVLHTSLYSFSNLRGR